MNKEQRFATLCKTEAEQFGLPVEEFERQLNGEKRKIYINGVLATDEDLFALEGKLRFGMECATGKIIGNNIYYKTI